MVTKLMNVFSYVIYSPIFSGGPKADSIEAVTTSNKMGCSGAQNSESLSIQFVIQIGPGDFNVLAIVKHAAAQQNQVNMS